MSNEKVSPAAGEGVPDRVWLHMTDADCWCSYHYDPNDDPQHLTEFARVHQPTQAVDRGVFDEFVERHISSLTWSDEATDLEKTLVAGNIRGFASALRRAHLYSVDEAAVRRAAEKIVRQVQDRFDRMVARPNAQEVAEIITTELRGKQ